jgi:K+/H+ antiporter YhaU regulatory subunit KhtT
MQKRVTVRQRLRYAADNFLARGSLSLFLALTSAFIGAIVLLTALRSVIDAIFPDAAQDTAHHAWVVFLELTDPGNMNQDNTTPREFKLGAIAAGMTGVVLFSSLIAFMTTALDQAIQRFKRGHSEVIESGHTLILGWTPRVVEILRELAEAMESERDPVVVILSETPKEELDELLRTELGPIGRMRVVTRTGPSSSIRSLELVNAREAKSAIVLASCPPFASEDEKLSSDARVIKTVLALCTHIGATKDLTVVAEVFDERNRKVVCDIAPESVVVLAVEEILAKIMVQTSRTSGLAVVYQELLSFAGSEIYFHARAAGWRGLTFGKLQMCFDDGVPIGVRTAAGEILVRPPASYVVADGDAVIIVAEDDSSIALRDTPVIEPRDLAPTDVRVPRRQERLLILGWSAKARTVVTEYGKYVQEGSSVDVMVRAAGDALRAEIAALAAASPGLSLSISEGDPLDRDELEARRPFDYDNVIVLPQEQTGDLAPERVDSESIIVLLHLRSIRRGIAPGAKRTKIVTEVLESSNQELVSKAGVDDVIISNRMVSMIFAQLSEQREIHRVYDNLFEEEGSEIYVKPASLYFAELPAEVRFGDLMHVAQRRDGEICIGIKKGGLEGESQRNYGVRLIPPKDEVLRIEPGDSLVVVAEDDS